jgi:hypothetical protein
METPQETSWPPSPADRWFHEFLKLSGLEDQHIYKLIKEPEGITRKHCVTVPPTNNSLGMINQVTLIVQL